MIPTTKRIQMKNGDDCYDFIIEKGRKYLKVVQVKDGWSIHAFVDRNTGDVYKAEESNRTQWCSFQPDV